MIVAYVSHIVVRFIEWPWALPLSVLLPLLVFFAVGVEKRARARRLAKLGTRSMLARLAPLGERFGKWRTVRLMTAVLLSGVAIAGPRWGVGDTFTHSNGVDVALALDASLSMTAPDATPTRLENMKEVVRQLRTISPNDRFALLAFAGHSYILSPLTTDQSALELYLTNLDPTVVGVAGSAPSSVIRQAIALLSLQRGETSRAIILMSDGEAFDSLAEVTDRARRAAEAGITLITVGFGTELGSTIPINGPDGAPTMKRDEEGEVVVTHYTPYTLSQAAQSAHGFFIPATAPHKAEQIRRILDGLKARAFETETIENLTPQFQWFVLPAFLLFLLDTLLVLRPKRRFPAAPRRNDNTSQP